MLLKYSNYDESITKLFEEVFTTFQKLDGTIQLENPQEEIKAAIDHSNRLIAISLRDTEINWRNSYKDLVQLMKENPVPAKPKANS